MTDFERSHMMAKLAATYAAQGTQNERNAYSDSYAVPEKTKPLIDVEIDRLAAVTAELEASVDWLVNKVQPVCQIPPPSADGKDACGQIQAAPSPLRQQIIKRIEHIEAISKRISSIRFAIEL